MDVRECARGARGGLEKGRPGERYILGGEDLTLKQILDKLGEITGLPSPKVKLPYVFAFATGVVDEAITGRIVAPRASCHGRHRADGQEENVCQFARKPSANWVGRLCRSKGHCDGRWSGSGPTDMSRVAIVAALEREVRPLVREWRRVRGKYDGRRFRFFEKDDVVLVCGGIGAGAARRAAEAVIAIYAPQVDLFGRLCRGTRSWAESRGHRASATACKCGRRQQHEPGSKVRAYW